MSLVYTILLDRSNIFLEILDVSVRYRKYLPYIRNGGTGFGLSTEARVGLLGQGRLTRSPRGVSGTPAIADPNRRDAFALKHVNHHSSRADTHAEAIKRHPAQAGPLSAQVVGIIAADQSKVVSWTQL